MNWHLFLYVFFAMAAGQGLFIASIIFLRYRVSKPSSKYLAFYIGSFSIIILYWTLFWLERSLGEPLNLMNFGEPFVFLLAPSLYFYISGKKEGFRLHILPALIPVMVLLPYYLDIYFELGWNPYGKATPHLYTIWTVLNLTQILIYLTLLIKRKTTSLFDNHLKLGLFTYFLGITIYLAMINLSSYTLLADYLIVLAITSIVYYTSYRTFLVRSLFSEPTQYVDKGKGSELVSKLRRKLENEEHYLNPSLKISDLAESINEPKHVISKVLNENYKTSFNEFINEYRIKKAEKLLLHTNDELYAVALESGFSNKVSFINNFKKFNGTTPAAYRSMHTNNGNQIELKNLNLTGG